MALLRQMGISPQICFIDYSDDYDIGQEEQAIQVLGGHMCLEAAEKRQALLEAIRQNMAVFGGRYQAKVISRWALLTWEK